MVTPACCSSFDLCARFTSARMNFFKFFGRGGSPGVPRARAGDSTAGGSADEAAETKRKRNGMAQQTLRSSLKAGKLTQQEYEERLRRLP